MAGEADRSRPDMRLPAPQDLLRFLRFLYMGTMGMTAALMVAGLGLMRLHATAPDVIVYVFYLVTAGDVIAAVMLRNRFSAPAAETLRRNPEDSEALMEWTKGQLLPLPLAVSVGMMGLACQGFGAGAARVAPIYGAALVLLLAMMPKELPV